MDFLGNVNVFHGRVQSGQAMVGNLEVEYPEYPHAEPQAATLYMRPHELDIALKQNGVPGLRASVQRVNPAGSVARIGLTAVDHDTDIQVDLSMDRYAELKLKPGDTVFVLPKRVRYLCPITSFDYLKVVGQMASNTPNARRNVVATATTISTEDKHASGSLAQSAAGSNGSLELALEQIRDALRGLRFGSISVVIQDGVVVQIERTEKKRLR